MRKKLCITESANDWYNGAYLNTESFGTAFPHETAQPQMSEPATTLATESNNGLDGRNILAHGGEWTPQ